MENWLREHEHGIKVTASVLAAAFAWVQYSSHLEEARVEKTLEFYKRFASEPIFSSRISVLESWEALWPRIKQLPTPHSSKEVTALRTQWKELVVTTVNNDAKLAAQINTIFDFFSALQVCVESGICDKTSAHELLKGAAEEFYKNYCPYVAHMRYDRKSTNFGVKAAAFADNPCKVEIFKDLPASASAPAAG